MEAFCRKLADILEVDELAPGARLEDYPEWDFLSVLTAISMISADYGVTLHASEV